MSETLKSHKMPATQGMLYEVRNELKSDIASVKINMGTMKKDMGTMKGDIHTMKGDIRTIKGDICTMKSEIVSVKSEMVAIEQRLGSKIDNLTIAVKGQNAKFHRMLTLYEEMDSRNKYVLDGYSSLNDRLEKLENPT